MLSTTEASKKVKTLEGYEMGTKTLGVYEKFTEIPTEEYSRTDIGNCSGKTEFQFDVFGLEGKVSPQILNELKKNYILIKKDFNIGENVPECYYFGCDTFFKGRSLMNPESAFCSNHHKLIFRKNEKNEQNKTISCVIIQK